MRRTNAWIAVYIDRECHSCHSQRSHTFTLTHKHTVEIINIERFFALIGFIDKKNLRKLKKTENKTH